MNRDDRRNFLHRRGSIDKLASRWANFAHSHQSMMESNPFNEDYQGPKEIFKKGLIQNRELLGTDFTPKYRGLHNQNKGLPGPI